MQDLILTILNMSVTASVVILFVLAARLLLKRSPTIFSYALWAVVLFRLLCPVSVTTGFSLLGLVDAPVSETTEYTSTFEYLPRDTLYSPPPAAHSPAGNTPTGSQNAVSNRDQTPGTPIETSPLTAAAMVWLVGMGAMRVYSALSFIKVRRQLIGSVHLRENIYLADHVDSPFVMGLIRPKIYLPSALSLQEQGYILLHEQHHIRRGDHVFKALAFLALCIHWFNPLVWLAFVLSGKDMEMSCDEAVVKKLGAGIRRDYSASLLSLATGRRMIAGTPLAFGEGDTKRRIKNMLRWKQATPAVILVSALLVILALIFCGTNTGASGSWIKGVHGATSIELEYHFADPIHSYAIYEDMYENGELLSSEAIVLDDLQDQGGATPRQGALSLNVHLPSCETGFSGQLSVHFTGTGTVSQTRKLPKEHYTGAGYVPSEIGSGIFGRQSIAPEDTVTLLTILLSDQPNGEVVLKAQNNSLVQSNDTVVIYRLVTSERSSSQYAKQSDVPASGEVSGTNKEPSPIDDEGRRKAEDIAYYLELAAGMEFKAMGLAEKTGILVEYEDLLDGYALIARESTDGSTGYVVGCFNGDPTQSPLLGMYGVELSSGAEKPFQFLYREEHAAVVETIMAENRTDFPLSAGYRIQDSRIFWSSNGETVLIQPKDAAVLLDVPYNRYVYTPNGREYIADAVSRGIDVCGKSDTFLYVYRIDQRFGEIAERIALTAAEAKAILAETRAFITDGLGFSATLHINGETTYYNEHSGIPQTVLDIAVERCDYRFGDPGMITDTIREARLDCDWLETPLYADGKDLPRLREMLKNAEFGYVGSCGYSAKLTLTFTGGEKLTVFKGCDGCDSIVFGSYSGYFLGDRENTEFWAMFGLDANTKLPLSEPQQSPPENPNHETDLPASAFSPSDVNYRAQALTASPDELTYQERLLWAQAEPDYQQLYTSLGRCVENDGCIAYLGQWVGTPHNDQYTFHIRFTDGSTAPLPLPRNGAWGVALPDIIFFREGTLIYETAFPSEETADNGQMLIHLKGTYHYEVDLTARTVSLTVLQ